MQVNKLKNSLNVLDALFYDYPKFLDFLNYSYLLISHVLTVRAHMWLPRLIFLHNLM